MTTSQAAPTDQAEGELKRSITGPLLFFYVLGDVLGSGIYVLVGAVAAAVGGAFWLAFALGITVATITGLAYAELVTKFPRAAGASLYVNKAFRLPVLTFLVTICMLSASFSATGALASGFARYFGQVVPGVPVLLVTLVFVGVLTLINFIGITESVVVNMLMTFVEVAGLVIVVTIGAISLFQGADTSVLLQFAANDPETGEPISPVIAIVAGIATAFFAMTGFENAANVAEETRNPSKTFPRSLALGLLGAGIVYVAVAISAALTVPTDRLASAEAGLLEVVRAGVLPVPVGLMVILFALIALVAISNTALVSVVTQSRILYGMAREGVFPKAFSRLHASRRSPWVALIFQFLVVAALLVAGTIVQALDEELDIVGTLADVTVVFLLFIYSLVIVSALKLRGTEEREDVYHASTPLLIVGLVANAVLLVYVVYVERGSLGWVAGLLALGFVLFLVARFTSGGSMADLDPESVAAQKED